MFKIVHRKFGKYKQAVLQSRTGKTWLACVPSFGANIISLRFEHAGRSFETLDGFQTEKQLRTNEKSKGIHLAPFPNRIEDGKYFFEGKSFRLPVNKPKENNAIHGFIWSRKFSIVNAQAARDFAAIELQYRYEGDYAGFPFPFSIAFVYMLSEDTFSMRVKAVNTGSRVLPFGAGWHPYFTFHKPVDDIRMRLPGCKLLEVNERMIPTGEAREEKRFSRFAGIKNAELDTAFALSKKGWNETLLRDAAAGVTLAIRQDNAFPYLQVYIPPSRNSIAVEPMTCPANAFNSGTGLLRLAPGQSFSGTIQARLIAGL